MKRRIRLFKQETGIKVGDIMTRNLILVRPDNSILDCIKRMIANRVGSVIVVDKNRVLKGIITKLDILRLVLKKKDLSKVKAKDIMIRKVRTIKPDVDLYKAALLIKKTNIKKLPVVEGKKVIGMIHAKDIVKFEPQLFEQFIELVRIREESEKLKRINKYRENNFLEGLEPKGSIEGPCEECGSFDWLEEIEGRLLCSECSKYFE